MTRFHQQRQMTKTLDPFSRPWLALAGPPGCQRRHRCQHCCQQLQSAPHLARARAPPHLARARAPPHLARAPPHLAGAHHLHLQSAPHLARARAPSWTMAGSRQDRRHQVQLQSSGPRQGSGRTWPGPGPHPPRAVEHLEWSWMDLAVSRQWPLEDAVLSAFSVIVPG